MKKKLKLNKCSSLKIFNKILKLIKTSNASFFRFKKLKGAMGYCEWEDGILLDYRRELLPTLVHECIHYLNPEWTETEVLYAEKRIINTISIKQAIKLLKAFAINLK